MRLGSLNTRSSPMARDNADRERVAANLPRWHVAPLEGLEADRERSLRDELTADTPEPQESAVSPEQRARDTAAALRLMGPAALRLIKADAANAPRTGSIDAVA